MDNPFQSATSDVEETSPSPPSRRTSLKRPGSAARNRSKPGRTLAVPDASASPVAVSSAISPPSFLKQTLTRRKKEPSPSTNRPEKFIERPPFPIAGYLDVQQVLEESRKRMQKKQHVWLTLRKVALAIPLLLIAAVMIYLQLWRSLSYCTPKQAKLLLKQSEAASEVLGVPWPLPLCRPCPPHATCADATIVECTNGYIKNEPLFPFHASCIPDVVKYANVEKMRTEMAQLLSVHAGAVECGNAFGEIFMTENEVKSALQAKHSNWERARFEDYWLLLVKDIDEKQRDIRVAKRYVNRLFVFINNSSCSGDRSVYYSPQPYYPLTCRITKSVLHFLSSYSLHLSGAAMLAIFLSYFYFKYTKKREYRRRILELVDGVLSVLIEQEERFRSGQEPTASLSVSHLRDFFLTDVRSLKDRNRMWKDVRHELLHHSSVRETNVLLHGEQTEAWLWIGSSSLLSPERRRDRGSPVKMDASPSRYPHESPSRQSDTRSNKTPAMQMSPEASLYPQL